MVILISSHFVEEFHCTQFTGVEKVLPMADRCPRNLLHCTVPFRIDINDVTSQPAHLALDFSMLASIFPTEHTKIEGRDYIFIF